MTTEGPVVGEGEAWRRLEGHLDWSTGPTISFVFTDDPQVVAHLRERAFRAVARTGGKVRWLHPEHPQGLREVLRDLLSPKKVELVWLEPYLDEGAPWADAWNDVLQRLNERRERLRRSLGGALVLVAPPSLKARFRDTAPDLWSIRSLVLDLATEPDPRAADGPLTGPGEATPAPVPDRRAERSNAYRTAEAVLRYQFHSRMRTGPWIALVLGDDPAPRRRLLDALVGRGTTALVHAGASPAMTAPTDTDVHWVLVGDEPDLGLVTILTSGTASRPVLVEGALALEAAFAERLPELYAGIAFIVRLHVERTLHPGPLPVLNRAEEAVRDVWQALDRARTLEQDLPTLHGRSEARVKGDRIRELSRAAEALLVQGWSGEAAPLGAEVLRSASELRPTDPDAAWLRAEAEELTGRIARQQGDLPEAYAHYESALPVRRRLAKGRGELRHRRRAELARCLSVTGELALEGGDIDAADPAIREALAIRRRLLRVTDDRETLSELAIAWSMLGDLELARHEPGDRHLDDATRAYREALRLRERIAAEEDSVQFRRLLSVAHGRVGRALARANDWIGARRALERAAELALALTRHDPGNVAWRMEASVASSRLGDASRALGDLAAAAAAYRDAADLRRRMLAEEPDNARWQELLAVALGRLAEIELATGDVEAAHLASQRAVELSEQLSWMDPGHLNWRRGLGSAWLRHADVAKARGRSGEADQACRRAIEVAVLLAQTGTTEGIRRAREMLHALEGRGLSERELAPVRGRLAASR